MKLPKFTFNAFKIRKKRKHVERTNRLLSDKTSFHATEAYKAARTNLMFILGKKNKANNGNVIVFTSCSAAEGKTTTCLNLALTIAQAGMRVLVIDADMRKPRLHKLFGIDASPGLSDKLSGMDERTCVYEISVGNLYVMPAGTVPPNPAELLASGEMDNVINNASAEFDYVFIDMPPIGIVTDAAIVTPKTAGAILVARYNLTTTDELKSAADQITAVDGKIIGSVLNDIDYSAAGYGYRYGSYRYGTCRNNTLHRAESFA